LTATATDPDGDTVTYQLIDDAGGKFEIDATNGEVTSKISFIYEDGASYSVTVKATSADGTSSQETFIIDIINANEIPTANNDTAIVDEDGTLNGTSLLANDSDVDGDDLTINTAPVTDVANGALTIKPDGTYTYIPDVNFNGTDSFVYEVCDNGTPQECSQATVTITVNAVNDTPIAQNDAASVDEDGTLNGSNLLANDSDPDGDDLAINTTPITNVINGTLTINVDGTYTYLPDANFNGTDSFVYEACDKGTPTKCTQARVTITVNPINDAPIAQNDAASINEDQTFSGANLLSNDSDLDGDLLTINTKPVLNVDNGELTINADGTYTYTPDENFNGTDRFVYEVCDNGTPSQCAQAEVVITVLPVNDAPLAFSTSLEVKEGSLNNGIDINEPEDLDGDDLTVEIISSVEFGELLTPAGKILKANDLISVEDLLNLTYNTRERFVGQVVAHYQVIDAGNEISKASITIDVTPMDVFVPEAITPNGDNYNDRFKIVGLENFPDNSLQIFNRWGNIVYKMNGYDNMWDGYGNVSGQISKKRLPPGTYYYVLKLGNGKKPLTGYIYMTY
jgi:gliding motility-associated-like protein